MRMAERLRHKVRCDRCKELFHGVHILSWFTMETLCMACSGKETELKVKLRAAGKADAMEGCGYIPTVEEPGG